jgi:hypothetical protein
VVVTDLGTPVVFNYSIVNNGSDQNADIEKKLKAAAIALVGMLFTSGSIWIAIATALIEFLGSIFGDCDGPRAVDQIEFTGAASGTSPARKATPAPRPASTPSCLRLAAGTALATG